MSKSKGNVIDPDEHVARVGADTVKTYLAFIGPYNEVGQYPWDLGGIAGVRRFLERVWNLKAKIAADGTLDEATALLVHQTVKKVGDEIAAFKFNTAISQLMSVANALEKLDTVPGEAYETLVRMVAPFAPHLAEELWEALGHTTSVHLASWPAYDQAVIAAAAVTIAVQVNGKLRDTFTAAPGLARDVLLERARALPKIADRVRGARVVKEVVVPDRLVNFVVAR
jgi:leucyl-tRNA synthetase